MRSVFLVGLTLVSLELGVRASEPAPRRFEFEETHMGSPFKMILYTSEETAARRASRAAFDRIKALDDALSDYNPESEIMRLCDKAGGPPTVVGDDLFDALKRSAAISDRTEGAFDVTIGPVGRLWRRARRDRKLPDARLMEDARKLVGWKKIRLDETNRTVRLDLPGMKVDFGGIAKGYASDHAVRVLKRHGIRAALVAGAGDITVSGPPPGRSGWSVGVAELENPGGSTPRRFLSLRDVSVSTSGDAERYVEIDGVRYSHILNPKTGLGMTRRSSITVIALDGGTADGLATALSVMPMEAGRTLIEETPGASAYTVVSENGRAVEYQTRGFRAWLAAGSPRADAP